MRIAMIRSVWVLFFLFPSVNLNMSPPTVYNHKAAVIKCCD